MPGVAFYFDAMARRTPSIGFVKAVQAFATVVVGHARAVFPRRDMPFRVGMR